MLNLKELSQAQASLQAKSSPRLAESHAAYSRGLDLLDRYTQTPSRSFLQQAINEFQQALTLSRAYLAPYIALGNLYFALRLPQRALAYLQAAKELAPRSEYVLKLQDLLTSGKPLPALETAPVSVRSLDYDQLYEDVEVSLQALLRQTLRMSLPERPSAESSVRETLAHAHSLLKGHYENLVQRLETLEVDIDTGSLKQGLRAIETRLRQIHTLSVQSEHFHAVVTQCQTLLRDVQAALSCSPPDDSQLDPFLDQCDALADQIDELESQSLCVDELIQSYKLLVGVLEQLQDALD